MDRVTLGRRVADRRREAGLTQAALAERMGTTQSAISKIESGRSLPTLALLDRFARVTGRPFTLVLGSERRLPSRRERARRVRAALGGYEFNPWDRDPSPVEARTLIADGLTRERFERSKPPRPRRG